MEQTIAQDECVLIKPDESLVGEIESYRSVFLTVSDSIEGAGPLQRMERAKDWLQFNKDAEDPVKKPSFWVVSEQFAYVRVNDRRIVGMIQFRHEFNDFLREFGGNIGYSVHPDERRKGYAKRMLLDCLTVCSAFGLDRVLITCLVENEGSRRTILSCGGVYDKTVYCARDNVNLERYWISLDS